MWAILRGRALQVFQTIHASRHMRRGSTPGKKGTRVPIGVLARKDARRDRREAESEETKQKRRATNTADKHKSLVAAKLKAGIMADSSRDRDRLDAAVPGLLRKFGSLVRCFLGSPPSSDVGIKHFKVFNHKRRRLFSSLKCQMLHYGVFYDHNFGRRDCSARDSAKFYEAGQTWKRELRLTLGCCCKKQRNRHVAARRPYTKGQFFRLKS
jgi:hypothetical protein